MISLDGRGLPAGLGLGLQQELHLLDRLSRPPRRNRVFEVWGCVAEPQPSQQISQSEPHIHSFQRTQLLTAAYSNSS